MLQDMVHSVLAPSVVSWNATIGVCEKGKQQEEALGTLLEILHLALAPDIFSWSAAVSSSEKCNR